MGSAPRAESSTTGMPRRAEPYRAGKGQPPNRLHEPKLDFTEGSSSAIRRTLVGRVFNDPPPPHEPGRPCRCLRVLEPARTNFPTYLVPSAMNMSRSSSAVNEVFPHKVCINLDRDRDSWERLQAALTRHDIRGVRRVSAVDA